jgi:hypothetical protein
MVQENRPTSEARTFDLDEVESPDVVRFGGESYQMARGDGLSLRQQAVLRRCRKRFNGLSTIEIPSEDDEREYRTLNREVAAIALPKASPDAIASLEDTKLERLVLHFFVRTATRSEMVQVARELTVISDAISPASSTSTAATPSAGST